MTELRTPALRGCFCCDESESSFARTSRRSFMLGAGALALATATGGGRAAAQGADAKPFRIDVHHHLSPPSYVTASNESGFGDPLMKNWTIEKSLADMDKAGIATAMLSVTTPGVNFTKPRRGAPAVPRVERICRQAGRGSSRPVRQFRDAAADRRRRQSARDRLRARYAEGRRHRADDELRRQMARRSPVPAGHGRTQPPQGAGLYPSDGGELLHQSGAHAAAGHDRIRHRYDAHHRRHRVLRQCAAVSATSAGSSRMPAARCRS